jgi:predicted ATPase
MALALYYASAVAQFLGDATLAARHAEAGRQLATEHVLPLLTAWSTGMTGGCAAENGDPNRGIVLLTEAITALEATQSRQFKFYLLGLLADVPMKTERYVDAMKAVEDGIALAEGDGERFYSAELHRLHGELLAGPPYGNKRQAEASFRIAIEVAKQQGAAALACKANASTRRWL